MKGARMIKVKKSNSKDKPQLFCDKCKEKITFATEGRAWWLSGDNVFFFHNGQCSREYERGNYKSEPIADFLVRLMRGLHIEVERRTVGAG
jgi:hypothetical protein